MLLEIEKLELKVSEKSLNELIWEENKEKIEKGGVSNFQIVLLKDKLVIEGRQKVTFLKVPFQITGKLRLLPENLIELEFKKLRAASFLPLSPARVVKEILASNPPDIKLGKKNSLIIDILASSQYPLKVRLTSLQVCPGCIVIKAG